MCGIWTYIELLNNISLTTINNAYSSFINMKNRGPDISIFQVIKNNIIIGFHRLAIMDLTFHANQPFIIEDNQRTIVFICNGEIYNFKELIEKHKLPITNNSDCMTIPQLYIKYKKESNTEFNNLFLTDIQGEFAFILLEFDNFKNLSEVIIGRDKIGIRPLYYHNDNKSNKLLFSSEIKGMTFFEDKIKEFEPGNLMSIKINNITNQPIYNIYNFNTDMYNIKQPIEYKICDECIQNKNYTYYCEKYYGYQNYVDSFNDNTENKHKLLDELTFCNKIDKEYKLMYIEPYLENIRNAVINSVKKRLISEKPIAFLLSGGVDSSLVAAIATKILGQPINTFCCGMTKGTDLLYAKKVAEHIKSNHTEVFFTEQEGLNVIDDVIYTTETWDTTTIRASVGQYLVSKYIGTKTDSKVIMVGEGPDEVCSSYLFNYYAPEDGKELHETALEYVKNIHLYDGRRADRCISRWGLEGRIALLDPEFIEAYWKIPGKWRHPKYKGIEKWWLRKAFESTNILPSEVLWRKKEAFSDGISGKDKSWFEIIQDHIKTLISENEFNQNTINATTIESYYYKKKFIDFYGENRLTIIPKYWQPQWIKNDETNEIVKTNNEIYVDPSARTLNLYNE